MALSIHSGAGDDYLTCRYGSSRLTFRGPPQPLDGRHIAFVGGSETIAKNIVLPYPMIVEHELNEVCINFGQGSASVEAFMHDPLVGNACRDAMVTVVSLTGAANLSNRLYSVHPRRNDRFLRPSNLLRAMYPDVDFTDICFTRHLLTRLHEVSADRFSAVREELQTAWLARMRTFVDRVGPNIVLLWFAPHLPLNGDEQHSLHPREPDPLFVTRRMVDALRPLARELVIAPPFPALNGANVLDEAAHSKAAAALLAPIQKILLAEGYTSGKTRSQEEKNGSSTTFVPAIQ